MASSVSSERAFSSAGITITKRRNRLKGDIVEALQVLKSKLRGGDIMRSAEQPSLALEEEIEVEEIEEEALMGSAQAPVSGDDATWNSDLLVSDDECYDY